MIREISAYCKNNPHKALAVGGVILLALAIASYVLAAHFGNLDPSYRPTADGFGFTGMGLTFFSGFAFISALMVHQRLQAAGHHNGPPQAPNPAKALEEGL